MALVRYSLVASIVVAIIIVVAIVMIAMVRLDEDPRLTTDVYGHLAPGYGC